MACEDVESDPTFSCCNIYGNVGGDWEDCIAGLDADNDNISMDPLYQDAEADDFSLLLGSPCLPFTDPNPACDLIGAWEESSTAVEISSIPAKCRRAIAVASWGMARIGSLLNA